MTGLVTEVYLFALIVMVFMSVGLIICGHFGDDTNGGAPLVGMIIALIVMGLLTTRTFNHGKEGYAIDLATERYNLDVEEVVNFENHILIFDTDGIRYSFDVINNMMFYKTPTGMEEYKP